MAASGMKILAVSDLEEAARIAVKISHIVDIAKEVDLNIKVRRERDDEKTPIYLH